MIFCPYFPIARLLTTLWKSVNLSHGNVGNKQVKKYSGGMKRRLSVAISLIGDPKVFFCFYMFFHFMKCHPTTTGLCILACILQVVFMDEPSTGLDPASRNNLWNVVREAKRDRAIILTSNNLFLSTCASKPSTSTPLLHCICKSQDWLVFSQ